LIGLPGKSVSANSRRAAFIAARKAQHLDWSNTDERDTFDVTQPMENAMTQSTQTPAADPDNVPETLCCGRFNLSFLAGSLATLTFTHPRPKAGPLFDSNEIHEESVVRARIVMHLDNLVALRNFLNEAIKSDPASMTTPASGGSGKPN
jgi:hypothetical protein